MSVSYFYVKRSNLNKPFSNAMLEHYFESYSIDQASIFCSVMGLPEIPYYYCSLRGLGLKFHDMPNRYYELFFNLYYIKDELNNVLTSEHISREKTIKRYNAYKHWCDWGLEKLNNIDVEYVKNHAHLKNKEFYGQEEKLETIKQNIKTMIDYYKKHYYRTILC